MLPAPEEPDASSATVHQLSETSASISSSALSGGQGAVFASGEPQRIRTFVAAVMEPGLATLALMLACWSVGEPVDRPEQLLSILILLLCFPGTNRFGEEPLGALTDILSSWASVLVILGLCGYATHSIHLFSHPSLYVWAILTPVLQFVAVQAGRFILLQRAEQRHLLRPALVVGANPLGARVAHSLRTRAVDNYDFIGFAEDRAPERLPPETRPLLRGRFEDLPRLIEEHRIRDVFVTLPLSMQPRIVRMLADLQDSAVSIHYVPDVFGISIVQGRMTSIEGVPVVALLESPFEGVNGLVKRWVDLVLASFVLLALSPLMLMMAAAVKMHSPGPVIVRHRARGVDGEEINLYGFRTSRQAEVAASTPALEPVVSRSGGLHAFLRRTSLDQLPLFINVLQGRLSIVGPKPQAVAPTEHSRSAISAYMVRHKVRPGITGWAQVHGVCAERGGAESCAAKVEYDLDYLRNWSLVLDLSIMARCMIQKVVYRKGA